MSEMSEWGMGMCGWFLRGLCYGVRERERGGGWGIVGEGRRRGGWTRLGKGILEGRVERRMGGTRTRSSRAEDETLFFEGGMVVSSSLRSERWRALFENSTEKRGFFCWRGGFLFIEARGLGGVDGKGTLICVFWIWISDCRRCL